MKDFMAQNKTKKITKFILSAGFLIIGKIYGAQEASDIKEVAAKTTLFEELAARSAAFAAGGIHGGFKFPTRDNRIAAIAGDDPVKQEQIAQHAAGVYPIAHHKVLTLMERFLDHKRAVGSEREKEVYDGMTVPQLATRLLTKRPLALLGTYDAYLLRDGVSRGHGGFEAIGTDQEGVGEGENTHQLILRNNLSYDEMQISALLGVSVPTYFINNGNRYNACRPGEAGSYQENGVYVGLVGARFEKPGLMESAHIKITAGVNTPKNGYGAEPVPVDSPKAQWLKIWAEFYGIDHFPTHTERAMQSGELARGDFFDKEIYKKRLEMSILPYLMDANARAAAAEKQAYCHVVGLGTGVWAVPGVPQEEYMLEVYADILANNDLPNIADVDFSYFRPQSIAGIADGEKLNGKTIHFSRRDPADKLDDANKLLVAMYAWDGGSYAGNEYWLGSLTASGDPAAACCSTIAELQNPEINPAVSGDRLVTYPR